MNWDCLMVKVLRVWSWEVWGFVFSQSDPDAERSYRGVEVGGISEVESILILLLILLDP
jgi:hypothetical protein